MLPSFISTPFERVRSAFSRSTPPNATQSDSPSPSGSLRRARPMSRASSITLGPPLPTPPPVAATQPSELLALGHQNDLISNFWGGGRAYGMQIRPEERKKDRESRQPSVHHFRVQLEEESSAEPKTLARRLFWFGFAFPLLWILGAFVLFAPTQYEPDLERASVGSAQDLQRHKVAYRAAEERWARRCLIAGVSFLGAVFVIVTTVILAKKNM
ncbi:hypothetical protein C8Q77DRAFT_1058460 [Trametes polyzona]|nr:hypothetical protein C8Q77DRAFT_1058460 [Trametes polyzona]